MDENRNHRITVRVTDKERDLLIAKANDVGMKLSEFVRYASLGRTLPRPKVEAEAWLQASRLLNNLNQIAKRLNEAKRGEDLVAVAKREVDELREEIMKVRKKLL